MRLRGKENEDTARRKFLKRRFLKEEGEGGRQWILRKGGRTQVPFVYAKFVGVGRAPLDEGEKLDAQ